MGIHTAPPPHRSGAGALPRPPRGMLFGMRNVLYDATLWRRWLLQILRRTGVATNFRAFYYIWDHDFLADVHRGRRDFCEAFRSFLLAAGLSRGQVEELEAACEGRRRHWESEARPLPGVRSTLHRLHAAGLILAVAGDSEHPAPVLQERLGHLGLEGLFTAVISSIDLGRTKPDPGVYLAALRAMKLPARDTAFVGHSAEELAGAADVGMMTIAYNFESEARADGYAARFSDLLDLADLRTHYAEAG